MLDRATRLFGGLLDVAGWKRPEKNIPPTKSCIIGSLTNLRSAFITGGESEAEQLVIQDFILQFHQVSTEGKVALTCDLYRKISELGGRPDADLSDEAYKVIDAIHSRYECGIRLKEETEYALGVGEFFQIVLTQHLVDMTDDLYGSREE